MYSLEREYREGLVESLEGIGAQLGLSVFSSM